MHLRDHPARSAPESKARGSPVCIGLVLSGGGLRGASHVGVLQQLVDHGIPIDVIVGSSAGAVVAAYYAAVGLTVADLIGDAERFRGRHLMAHSLSVRLPGRLGEAFTRLSGLIPDRLAALEQATFDRLHHNVRGLGIACHDLASGRPCYFTTGADRSVRLSDVVRASASLPFLFPAIRIPRGDAGGTLLLTDGGLSDGLPIDLAQRPPLGATHLIVSDCRGFAARHTSCTERIVYVTPQLSSTGTLRSPASTLATAVREGRSAVTTEMVMTIRDWVRVKG